MGAGLPPTINLYAGRRERICPITLPRPRAYYFAGTEKNDISITARTRDVQLTAIVTPEGSKVTRSSDDAGMPCPAADERPAKRMGATYHHPRQMRHRPTPHARRRHGLASAALVATPHQPTTREDRDHWAGVPDPNVTIRAGDGLGYGILSSITIDPSAAVNWSVSTRIRYRGRKRRDRGLKPPGSPLPTAIIRRSPPPAENISMERRVIEEGRLIPWLQRRTIKALKNAPAWRAL